MSSSILVTGASGFVGRRLCQALLSRGHQVYASVRTPHSAARLPVGVTVVVSGELEAETVWETSLLDRIDVIIHLAARVHLLNDRANDPPAEFMRVNVGGTEALALAAAGRVRRFVYVSSVHAMCVLADNVLDERSPCRPETPYGRSKLAAEIALRRIAERTGLELVIVRPAPVYGPENRGNLARLFGLVQRGWPLPLCKIGNRRSFVYVDNLVDALAAAARHPAARNETFLLGDGEDLSLAELIARVGDALGRRARTLPVPLRLMQLVGGVLGKSDAVNRLTGSLAVDSGKIRQHLQWQAPYSVDDGLAATAIWMRKGA